MLQLHESEAKLQDAREENESLLAHLKEVEFNMKNVLNLNAKLQDKHEYLISAHDFLIKNVIQLEDDLKKAQQDKIDLENRSKIIDNVYGHKAFECATRLNRIRQESPPSHVMKATKSTILIDEEKSEGEKLIAFTAKVEQDTMSSVFRRRYYSEDALSNYSSFVPKDETDQSLDLDVKNDYIFKDVIKVKKCNIKLLKRFNESEQKILQLQESEAKLQDAKKKMNHS